MSSLHINCVFIAFGLHLQTFELRFIFVSSKILLSSISNNDIKCHFIHCNNNILRRKLFSICLLLLQLTPGCRYSPTPNKCCLCCSPIDASTHARAPPSPPTFAQPPPLLTSTSPIDPVRHRARPLLMAHSCPPPTTASSTTSLHSPHPPAPPDLHLVKSTFKLVLKL